MAVSIIEPVVFYFHDNPPDRPLRAPPVEPCPDQMGRPGRDRPSRRQSALRVRRRLSRPCLVPLRRHGRGHGTDDEGRGGAGPHVRRPSGLSRAPRTRLPQVPGVRGPRGDAGEHLRRERLGPRPLARVQRVVDPGDPIICEAPTFSGSLNNIRRHGPEILDAPVDADGIVTSVVRERLAGLKRQGPRGQLIYTIANLQNPAGPRLSRPRRPEPVLLAQQYDTLILEDH